MVATIRSAGRSDAVHVAALMDIAGHGIEAEFWNDNVDSDLSSIAAARRLILEEPTLPYHLSRAFILDLGDDIAGGLIGGAVAETNEVHSGFPDYFAPLLELETRVPGYWAVIGVAVYREFRGRGFAGLLLDHAEAEARRVKSRGLSIVVEDSNTVAVSLYRKRGFQDHESRPWLPYNGRTGPQNWLLLTREF